MLNFHVLQVCCFLAVWDSMFCYQFFCGHVHDDAVTCSEAGVVHAITVPICLFIHVSEICDCTSLFILYYFMLFDSKLSCICFMQEWYVRTWFDAVRDDPGLPTFLSRDLEGLVTLNFRFLEVCCFRAVWNMFFPESACEGFSVKKQPLYYIFTPSHLLIYIFTPSHLQIYIFTPSHLQI